MSLSLPNTEFERRFLTHDEEHLSPLLVDRGKFISTIHSLASSNIGEDPLIKGAFLGLLLNEAQSTFSPGEVDDNEASENGLLYIMQSARLARSKSESPLRRIHAALVALYSANYIFMNNLGDLNYPENLNLNSPAQWQNNVWSRINDDPSLREEFTRLLHTKELNTSDPNRGNDFPFIASRVHGGKLITINDFGASFGFPWAEVASQDGTNMQPFKCKDKTQYNGRSGLLMEAAKQPLNINKVILVDHVDPSQDIPWFIANDYPKNITPEHIAQKIALIQKFSQLPMFEFRKGNMIANPPVQQHGADILSVVMAGYELPWQLQQKLVNNILPKYTAKGGIQIVKDYVRVDSKTGNLIFTNERKPFTCATAVRGEITGDQWLIVTRHSNSRCRETINGEHFEAFMQATENLPHNIA